MRTLRIKIFKKEGTSWGNQVFPLYSKADIRGITYNLENGEIVESRLKSESIFTENVTKNYFRVRIAMPNVREGSIIDLNFSYQGLPAEWLFQQEVPVRWSELILDPSPYVNFRKNFFGFEHLTESTDWRWVGKEMPAFKREPYMNSVKNYMTKFEIEILNISFPGFYREFSTSWEAVNYRLAESQNFGKAMQGCSFLNTIAREIKKNYPAPFDQLKAAHNAIKKAVKWNERESVISSDENLSSAFNKKIGNCSDVNLMLIQLLKKLDFEVYPVALSTRENGFLSPVNPSLEKLNYVIAYVWLGDKKYFVDATEEFLPVDMLPQRCINLQGRLIDDKKSAWIDLSTEKKNKIFIQYDLKLEAENMLAGILTKASYDYAALDFRKNYEKFNSKEEYLKHVESQYKGLRVIDCEIANLDSIYRPVTETYRVKIKNVVMNSGSQVYINPLLFEQMTSNPFKAEERKYPVDFISPSDLTYLFKLTLPDGATITELPKPVSMKLADGSAAFFYQLTAKDNVIQLTYRFRINKAIFPENEYANLRALFSELIKKHAEQIVLKSL